MTCSTSAGECATDIITFIFNCFKPFHNSWEEGGGGAGVNVHTVDQSLYKVEAPSRWCSDLWSVKSKQLVTHSRCWGRTLTTSVTSVLKKSMFPIMELILESRPVKHTVSTYFADVVPLCQPWPPHRGPMNGCPVCRPRPIDQWDTVPRCIEAVCRTADAFFTFVNYLRSVPQIWSIVNWASWSCLRAKNTNFVLLRDTVHGSAMLMIFFLLSCCM